MRAPHKLGDIMYKYEILTTCHVGGRMCRAGKDGVVNIVEFRDEIVSPYLKPIGKVKVVEPVKKKGQALSSLGKKPEIITGMAAKRKTKE